MFQFRRFPAYAYFIQRRLTEYCSAGLPHSEISGSMRMCRSPKLIAACHVLRRFLMPRHSPCALISLTSYQVDSSTRHSPQTNLVLSRIMQASECLKCFTTSQLIVVLPLTKQLPPFRLKVPQFKPFLCCLLFHSGIITLFSFQGAASNLLRSDFSAQITLSTEIRS